MRLWRALDRLLAFLPVALSTVALALLMSQNPFAAPYLERSTEAVALELRAALAREVTPEWYMAEMDRALLAEDLDAMRMVSAVGGRHGIAPSPALLGRMQALEARETGALAAARNCAVCAADITACPRVALLAMCGVTVEMTPLGDLNALRRAAQAGIAGEEIDRIEVALAGVGLGATGLVLASGGTSATVKVGATSLRLARRLGTVSTSFADELRRLSDVGFRPDRLDDLALGKMGLDEVADPVKLARVGELASDLGRVAANSSLTDAVLMLRHVDDAADARRLARLSDAAGPDTRATLDILGKGRAFRALVRLSDLAIGAAALLWLLAGQVLIFLGERVGRMLLSLIRAPVQAQLRQAAHKAPTPRAEPPLTRPQPQLRPDPPLRRPAIHRPVAPRPVLGHTPAE
ncbi:hypothetical protein O4G76_12945 [Limimaricola sp. G21655-S1]|uniref:hypothetical protein n=1 Tax=Limimaricola sp. G21655-S1 TaxID=3014768 RepID=UPI0022AEFE32|nr:hypothetical protein [Limimaricola sp. G21655-S1]MCZ4261747.1 hypothetical protein [Limimaricola sp. G21655-S1]